MVKPVSDGTRIQLCGRLAAEVDGRDITSRINSRAARELFAYLVLNRLQPVDRDELLALVAVSSKVEAEQALRKVRSATEPYLEGRTDLQLRLPVGSTVDLESAGEAVHRAETAIARQDWPVAWHGGRVALHIVRRKFLPGSESPWVLAQRTRLRDIEVRAHECIAMTGLGMGGTELSAADRSGRALMVLDPIRESGYRFPMEVAAQQGNQAEAVHLYNQLRQRLSQELGIGPGDVTRKLYERITASSGVNAGVPASEAAPSERDIGALDKTFMFTDICASTPLLIAVGDQAWQNLIGWHDRTLRHCFEVFGGEEVDHAGDGFFVAFGGAQAAIRCAIAVQRALDNHRREHGFAPEVRIGLHRTQARCHNGKYFGRGVHEAARIGALAEAGEIVASVVSVVDTGMATTMDREVKLKGVDNPVMVTTIDWRLEPD